MVQRLQEGPGPVHIDSALPGARWVPGDPLAVAVPFGQTGCSRGGRHICLRMLGRVSWRVVLGGDHHKPSFDQQALFPSRLQVGLYHHLGRRLLEQYPEPSTVHGPSQCDQRWK